MSVIDFTRLVAVEGSGLDKSIDTYQLFHDLISYHLANYFLLDKEIIHPGLDKIHRQYPISKSEFKRIDIAIARFLTSTLRSYGREYKAPILFRGFKLTIPYIDGGVDMTYVSRCDVNHHFSIGGIVNLLMKFFKGDIRFKDYNAYVDVATTYVNYELSKYFIGLANIEEHPLTPYFSHEELLVILDTYRRIDNAEYFDCQLMSENNLLGYVFDELDTLISSHVEDIMSTYKLKGTDVTYFYKVSDTTIGVFVDRNNIETYVFKMVADTRNGKIISNLKDSSILFCRSYL